MRVPVDLVVPIKELRRAKSRLVPASATLPGAAPDRDRAHRALVLAMAHDTLRAATAAMVRRVTVVTAEHRERLVLPPVVDTAVEVVADPGGGLNAAVRRGADHLRRTGDGRPAMVAVLQADLPALTPVELDAALESARGHLRAGPGVAAFVADHTGAGTTLLITAAHHSPDPRFGPGSSSAHRGVGAIELDGDWPGLRADVDTPDDLERVRRLGAGPATRAWPRCALSDPLSVG